MCTICNGHPNCPTCSPEPIECTSCEGGSVYILYNDNEEEEIITEEQYKTFLMLEMEDDLEKRDCKVCEGTGEIYN